MAELNPRTALEHARAMVAYVQAFNGQTFSPSLDNPDRQNLAMALDHLEETAAMLLNMAGRAAPSAPPVGVREPLTDEQIEKLAVSAFCDYMNDRNDDQDLAFARAIERAVWENL